MLYLLLAIASSATIAIVMRFSAGRTTAKITMLAANYLTCLLLAALYAGFRVMPLSDPGLPTAAAIGAVNGVLYLLGFVLLQYNTAKSGVVLSSVFGRLGLLVPMVLSIFLFGEIPTALQWVGFALALGAIVLINYQKGTSLAGFPLPLVLMLLAGGCGDAMSKVFEVYGPDSLSEQFLFFTFGSAFVVCVIWMLLKKEKPDLPALLFGLLVGIPNFFSAKYLLLALGQLPAVIVYPTFSVAAILVITLAGICLFKERLRKTQWAALAVILTALILLNI